jgi:hypothetical protein
MRAVLALALVGLVGCAAMPGSFGRYASSDDLPQTLDAYARAAHLQPLRGGRQDELRMWARDYMTGAIDGYIVSRSNAIECHATSAYEDGVVSIGAVRCRRFHDAEGVLRSLDDLAPLGGMEWDCEVEDGVEVLVEGVRDGTRFVFEVSNPGFCTDPGSRAVANLLHELGG